MRKFRTSKSEISSKKYIKYHKLAMPIIAITTDVHGQ